MVGMEKNCGKTECLNYIIRRLPLHERKVCVTSIGLDGERTDQVTRTPKPEIVLREGMFFSTSETHYRARRMVSEIVDISDETTALGRLITAKVVSEGKVILSGPSSTASLRRWMSGIAGFGIDLTIIDGALSRKSSASPAVSDAMVLATGAALSSSLPTLIDLTAFCVTMIRLPLAETPGDAAHTVTVSSMASDIGIGNDVERVEVTGALTDRLLSRLTQEGGVDRYDHQDIRHSRSIPQFCPCRRKAWSPQTHSAVGRMCQPAGSQWLSYGFGTLVRKTFRQVADTGIRYKET